MENQSDAPPTKRTKLLSAVDAAVTCAQSAATGTDAASSAIGPVMPPERNTDDAPRNVRVQVEAFLYIHFHALYSLPVRDTKMCGTNQH